MKKKEGFEFGRMLFGCVFVAFVSVFVWIMSDVFVAPSLKGYETIPCRIVKSSVKMERSIDSSSLRSSPTNILEKPINPTRFASQTVVSSSSAALRAVCRFLRSMRPERNMNAW